MVNKVLAILPAYNEEGKVGKSINDILPYVDTVLVIDDGSIDNTYEEAINSRAIVIRHDKNKGIGSAFKNGIRYAIKNKYNLCVHFAADYQDDASYILNFLEMIKKGYDYIQGSRYMKFSKRINHPLFRTFSTCAYSLFFSIVVGRKITDGSNGFRCYKTAIFKDKRINIWQEWLNRYELEPYFYYKVIKCGYKTAEVGVTKRYPKDKKEGYTKMKPLIDWWRITKPLIYLSFGWKR